MDKGKLFRYSTFLFVPRLNRERQATQPLLLQLKIILRHTFCDGPVRIYRDRVNACVIIYACFTQFWMAYAHIFRSWRLMHVMMYHVLYEPVTKGRDLKWDTLPQNQTPSKLFSVLPLESDMFQVTISIIKKWFWSKCVLYGIKTGVRSGVDVCIIVTMDTVNVIIIQRKTICMQF